MPKRKASEINAPGTAGVADATRRCRPRRSLPARWREARRRAHRRGKEFAPSLEDYRLLTTMPCYYCGGGGNYMKHVLPLSRFFYQCRRIARRFPAHDLPALAGPRF